MRGVRARREELRAAGGAPQPQVGGPAARQFGREADGAARALPRRPAAAAAHARLQDAARRPAAAAAAPGGGGGGAAAAGGGCRDGGRHPAAPRPAHRPVRPRHGVPPGEAAREGDAAIPRSGK